MHSTVHYPSWAPQSQVPFHLHDQTSQIRGHVRHASACEQVHLLEQALGLVLAKWSRPHEANKRGMDVVYS